MKHLGYGAGYRYAHDDYAAMGRRGRRAAGRRPAVNLPDAASRAASTSNRVKPGRRSASLRAWIDARRGSSGEDPFAGPVIYLDHAATTTRAARSRRGDGAAALASGYNPSSIHADGRRARAVLDAARADVARALGARAARDRLHRRRYRGGRPRDLRRARARRGPRAARRHDRRSSTTPCCTRSTCSRDEGWDVTLVARRRRRASSTRRRSRSALRPDTVLAR